MTDANQEPKDAIQETGQPSKDSADKPSTPPETLTRVEAEKLADQKADEKHSKLDTRLRELEKAGTRSTAALEAANRRTAVAEESLAVVQVEKDRAELEAAHGSPDALSLYQAKIAARERKATLDQRESDLTQKEADHADEIAEARVGKAAILATTIARETGVDASQLLNLTDGSEEKMRAAAEVLPKLNAPVVPANIPDSGTGKGGGRKLSDMDDTELADISDKDYFKRREAGEELKSS